MSSSELIIPEPRVPVSVRQGTMEDFAFIDSLQKMHTHMVGWMPRKQLESYIEGGHVLVAEADEPRRHEDTESTLGSERSGSSTTTASTNPSASVSQCLRGSPPKRTPLGYCIFKDQYLKRDDVGIIYQLNVMPVSQGNLIGATLVKAAFERAAYGCKLFCCWCAQDIRANFFWEAIGFVPLAFRTGSRGKQRIHIFWQKRIREGDRSTEWWFPYQTGAGAVREDRIVLPIPPEVHWRDVMPVVLPELEERKEDSHPRNGAGDQKKLPGGAPVRARPEQPMLSRAQRALIQRSQSAHLKGVPLGKKAVVTGSGIKYVDRSDFVPELDDPELVRAQAEKAAKAEEKKQRAREQRPRAKKNEARLVAKARELRDKYLEQVNAGLILPAAWSERGKYEVSRALLLEDQREREGDDRRPCLIHQR